jgi:hypothetical protein
MSPLAEPVWQIIPIATLVQFPWRLLGMTAFTLSIVAGSLLSQPDSQLAIDNSPLTIGHSPLLLLCLVILLASFPYTLPQYTDIPAWAETPLAVINWDRASIIDRVGMVSVTQEQPQTSPLEQKYLRGEPLPAAAIIAGQGNIETIHRGGASSRVRVNADEPVTVQFYTYDYPGWQVVLDDRPIEHRPGSPYGLITVEVPAGEHILRLSMGTTPPRTVGTIMSSLALLTIIALIIQPNRQPE